MDYRKRFVVRRGRFLRNKRGETVKGPGEFFYADEVEALDLAPNQGAAFCGAPDEESDPKPKRKAKRRGAKDAVDAFDSPLPEDLERLGDPEE